MDKPLSRLKDFLGSLLFQKVGESAKTYQRVLFHRQKCGIAAPMVGLRKRAMLVSAEYLEYKSLNNKAESDNFFFPVWASEMLTLEVVG
ncbi:hypothetical protein NPIL_454531 [Nephila pilipes]|uniref:Uncharacterized protein n=1 Tax=Nephila pilipes TaxID=299642 RepID=A0A8X6PDW4_NEPPI|nr:hypothetical protein NPIL_454531 [Nephila pilipes]